MMTSRGGSIGGLGLMSRIRRLKIHVLPFTDHAGKEACMVFEGRETCSLPPLYTIAVYFTHPDASPDTVDPKGLLAAIRRNTPLSGHCSIRLDLYFVPSAAATDVDQCIAHYQAEKSSRGDYTRQIQAIENLSGGRDDTETAEALPGLVPSYIDDPTIEHYHGLLYICQDKDWRAGNRMLCRVCFDPIGQDEYASSTQDSSELEVLAPTYIAWDAIERDEADVQGPDLVGMRIFETSHMKTENETDEPWQEAVERGWTSW
ncbi:hypothetical protein F4820DRAFT_22252 [Hypoxylon rubiginosum]|uniref:Uncharacterized protein n=1 Tax=Hypoxylon rubiginosum TaxID=110542 RepID=A0ACB9YSY1_9PEZI|nr:hypothetical protein F4820DRAFT_22252 [Hypoxylon rubiginosum]